MIFITGASGLLGANLVKVASQHYDKIVALYYEHPVCFSKVSCVCADLNDKDQLSKLIDNYRPQWVIHCAALTNVDWCEQNPGEAYKINVEGTFNVCQASKSIGARVIYISTDSVFNGQKKGYSERDIPEPVNVYAKTKLEGEMIVGEEEANIIIRTNIYGWNVQPKLSLAEWMLAQLEAGGIVPGFIDVSFNPILVNDLSQIILELMEKRSVGLLHIGGSEFCTKYDFAQKLAFLAGLNQNLIQPASITNSVLKAERPRNTYLLTRKVSEILGKPMPDVVSGLKRFLALRDSGYVQDLKKCMGD